jgi:hypothetical protein
MIGLLADVGSMPFPSLVGIMNSQVGLSGPVGLDSTGGSAGLSGGVGLDYSAASGNSVGLNGGVGLFA